MVNPLTWLSRKRFPYQPLIQVNISKSRLIHNLSEFRKIAPGGKIAPVLKSNAYGHGLAEVAKILKHEHNIPFFVVDSYFEALALRAAGIRQQILVIGYTRPETIISSRLQNIVYTITSLESLRNFESIECTLNIHLKIDTGMHRQGILPSEVNQAIDILGENPNIKIRGLCSHLCDADNPDQSYTDGQIQVWNKIAHKFKATFPSLEHLHLSATDGHNYTGDIEANVSRLGLGLYGLADGEFFQPKLDLKPVLEMKTIITGTKRLLRDESVGYGNTFKAQKNMMVATIPVGYFEGMDRRLSNCGILTVRYNNTRCPIVGRVSMNITSIDISETPQATIGTEVTVISNDPEMPNCIRNMAKLAGGIPYELPVHIPSQLKRTVTD